MLDAIKLSGFNVQPRATPKRNNKIAQIAQSVEQGTENPRVGGSIPPLGTISLSHQIPKRL
jgi:hypothetical protein